ncbi:ABC transporter permease [Mycoplasmopsis pullorum]|uniref:carbohydrate ABC transporter permease n=1 Tax=Mycoplasmopsis pullorum TaxID=48003 RepID=UPI00111B8340|nr:carbohydrate ABC transporter permease [Mycoplasmopsis pullorum]TNK81694.1 ABC transporter permease [Mycoplasmopsis pullorum]TNK82859.1 ABC transporter permease [Mycoplasmopsis pullorum]TNK84468.1 ABC transporter permease [Mycoplasmopsis pullorum]TNK84957.1 ABC transporter permease [Mycoplasmopsis pullorum]TNK85859.1 ABC transporter permease [Mycoplasmopsis pullorum]
MFTVKLLIKQMFLKRNLRSKQEKVANPIETTKYISKLLIMFFKLSVLLFFGAVVLFPFYFMIANSLFTRQLAEDTGTVHLVPRDLESGKILFEWSNYAKAFQDGYWKALIFTSLITAVSIAGKTFFSMTFGYAFSLKQWRFKNAMWFFFLSLLVLPELALLSQQYIVIVKLGWKDAANNFKIIIALTMPFVASVFSGFMFRNAFEAINDSVRESAKIDGASELKFFVKIAIPMIKPTIWTVAILTAFASWNSYLWPSTVYEGRTDAPLLSIWLFTTGKEEVDGLTRMVVNIRMAGAVLVVLPLIIIYSLIRKRIMNAISRQGVATKG